MRRLCTAALPVALLVATAALAQEAKLEFKLQPGSYKTLTNVKVHQILSIAGMDVTTDATVGVTTGTKVNPRADDGTVRIDQKNESMVAKLELPAGQSVSFDSAKPDASKSDVPQLQAIIDSMKVQAVAAYSVVIGKANKAVRVEGLDKLLNGLPDSVQEASKQDLNAETIKRDSDQTFGLLPDQPVKKGDRWTRTVVQNIGGGQTFTLENFYEYQGTVEKGGKTYDKLGVFTNSVKYAITPNPANPVEVKASDLKVDSSMGTILFDREQGRIVESSTTMHIVGPMTLAVGGMELGAKLDLTMESNEVSK